MERAGRRGLYPNALAERLAEHNMTQAELARRLGKAPQTISNLVRGERKLSSVWIAAIQRVLPYSADQLLRNEADTAQHSPTDSGVGQGDKTMQLHDIAGILLQILDVLNANQNALDALSKHLNVPANRRAKRRRPAAAPTPGQRKH